MTATAHAYETNIRRRDIHRWLNPFRVWRSVLHTRLSPAEVRDALRPRLYEIPWHPVSVEREHCGVLQNTDEIALQERGRGRRWLHLEFDPKVTGTTLRFRLTRSKLDIAIFVLMLVLTTYLVAAIVSILVAFSDSSELDASIVLFSFAIPGYLVARYLLGQWRRRGDLDHYHAFLASVISEVELEAE